jgi:histone-lysine N-methyltransferase SETMAR
MVKLSNTSLRWILHDHLGMHKVSARWVPKLLSAVQRQHRVECARTLLKLCGLDPKAVLKTIETMVLYYDPLPKKDSMESRRQGETPPRKFRVCQSTKMVMATIFCDCEGLLLIDFKETNTTVKGKYYAVLLYKLRDNIPGEANQRRPDTA